jgi:hypothetical protein
MTATHTLQLSWIGNSGESYVDLVSFSVNGSTVVAMNTSATADGKILFGGPRNSNAFITYTIEQGRCQYKRCLADGYKPVEQLPELVY